MISYKAHQAPAQARALAAQCFRARGAPPHPLPPPHRLPPQHAARLARPSPQHAQHAAAARPTHARAGPERNPQHLHTPSLSSP